MRKSNISSYGRLLLSAAALAAVLTVGAPSARAAEANAAAALSDMERLVAIEEIRQLKFRWWMAVDDKKWDEVASLFASPDTKIQFPFKFPDGRPVTNAKEFAEFCDKVYYKNRRAVHLGLNPVITLISPTEAEAVWAFEAVEYPEVDGKPGSADKHIWGRHDDRYIKTANGWRIAAWGGKRGGMRTSTEYAPVKSK